MTRFETSRQFTHRLGGLVAVILITAGACTGDVAGGDDQDAGVVAIDAQVEDECGDVRAKAMVYYGTATPTYLPMSQGQIYAVGSFDGCSGLLITPTWVLTAKHCGLKCNDEFCIDYQAEDPAICIGATRVVNGSGDTTLMELEQDARNLMPEVIPVPILTEDLTTAWIGRTAEAAGYGQQEDGGFNEREFTAEPIVSLNGDMLTIDGEGTHGVCFGDSGGPVMVIASDSSIRVAGSLSYGDQNCVGQDSFTRVDSYRDWIESYTGPTQVDPVECGDVTEEGRCINGAAIYCGPDDFLVSDNCSGGTSCGWDAAAEGYRCIAGVDPCGGYDNFGVCEAGVARWCEDGEVKARDCGACDQSCVATEASGGANCI